MLRALPQAPEQEAGQLSAPVYRSVVEFLPDGVVVHVDERIVYANQAAARLLGAQNPAELLGRSPMAFVHSDWLPLVRGRRQRIAEGERVCEP